MTRAKFLHVVGARPNFMKAAPVMSALAHSTGVHQVLVHTGQHYDPEMSDVFLADLGLPQPNVNLEVGSGKAGWQTAEIMARLEPVLDQYSPEWTVVYGDVNSTFAAALVAAKAGFRVAHVEAGLRSFDRTMPEEINRVLTDQLADLLFITEEDAAENLSREGIAPERIHFSGNVMIDSLVRLLPRAELSSSRQQLGLDGPYFLVTLHRPNNVDNPDALRTVAAALAELAGAARVVFPVHPRTRQALDRHDLADTLGTCTLLPPLGYTDFLALERAASCVITDSGGVQEETTYLGVPCVTIRPNTERPITLTHGTNRLVAADKDAIVSASMAACSEGANAAQPPPPLWDGHAGDRIAAVLAKT